jgi:hypothetical protein
MTIADCVLVLAALVWIPARILVTEFRAHQAWKKDFESRMKAYEFWKSQCEASLEAMRKSVGDSESFSKASNQMAVNILRYRREVLGLD